MSIIVSDNVRSCEAGGNDFPLGLPFSFMDGCIKYNCDCHSDGSWECPADRAEDTCQHGRDKQPTPDQDRTRTDTVRTHTRTMVVAEGVQVRHCRADGRQHPLGRPFSFTEDCFRFNCQCHSDGSWECPSERSEYICPLRPGQRIVRGPSKKMTIIVSDNARACFAKGNQYSLGRPFSFMDGCFKYNCVCHTDGSWECPADRAEDTCRHDRDRQPTPDHGHTRTDNTRTHTRTMVVAVGTEIRHCTVDGRQYPVGRPFSFNEDCFQFNCECFSGGSWECPSERSKYICPLRPGQRIVRGPSKKMTIIVSDNVRACIARGNEYPLGRPFSFMDGCIRYKCQCHSDGSWECPADEAEDSCQHGRDRQPTPDSDHNRTETTRTHTRTMVVAVGTQIRHCTAEGNQYPVGRPFSFTEGCFRFNCQCHSDGSWECPSERSEYICQLQPGQRIVRGPSKKMTIIVSDNVRACIARGNEYPLGRPFSLMDGCIKYNCDCHSDGSWECPADKAEDTCNYGRDREPTPDHDRSTTETTITHTKTMVISAGTVIRHCVAGGNQYPVGRPFTFNEGCFRFQCQCYSDGSWQCPAESSAYICRLRPGQKVEKAPGKKLTIIVNDNVRACVVKGNDYSLGRPFSFLDGCIKYNCECKFDGSWECPANRVEDLCQNERDRQPIPGTTREATIRTDTRTVVVAVGTEIRHCTADGKQYPMGRPFSFNEGCFRFNCQCHSDGSWECPSERSEYICRLRPGQRIVRGPSKKMTIIVSDNVRACMARENEYPLGRPFSFMDGCFRYNCDCHSDGSWECSADRAENICRHGQDGQETSDGNQIRVITPTQKTHTRTMVVAVGTEIRHCVAEGNQYQVGRPFSFTEGCFRFNCECYSDGSWECPSQRSEYVCQLKPGQRIVRGPSKKMTVIISDNVRSCVARGNEYTLGRPFFFMDGCIKYNCECHSDGSWECPADKAEDKCQEAEQREETTGQPETTKTHTKTMVVAVGTQLSHCMVEGKQFAVGRPFSFTEGCYQFNCDCHLDGSWECPSESSEYVCPLETGEEIVQGPSKKMTIVVSDNLRSCVAKGNEYALNQSFSFVDGCIRYNCECHFDGSWECPASKAEDTCQQAKEKENTTEGYHMTSGKIDTRTLVVAVGTEITHCTAEGNQYPVGRPFYFTEGCFRFNCECYTNGSWNCPSDRSEYTCPPQPGQRVIRGPGKKMTIVMSDNPRACIVRGNEYLLGQPFTFTEGCFKYYCECHVDGSWECSADKAEDVCQRDRQVITNERTHFNSVLVAVGTYLDHCTVDGREYAVGQAFSFTEGCFQFNCQCYQNGSWECPSERSEYTCDLHEGQKIIRGPSKKMTIVINSNPVSCIVRGNEHALGHPFSFMDGCFRYHCECRSDGSWECPPDRAEDTCRGGRDRTSTGRDHTRHGTSTEKTHTRTMVVAVGTQLRHCTVEGRQYPISRPFSFNEGCFRFNCECYSDGSWECPSERSEYICRLEPGQRIVRGPSKKLTVVVSDNVRACVVRGSEYSLGRPFSFMDGCIKYNCDCHSDGSWECPAEKAEDACDHRREEHRTREEHFITGDDSIDTRSHTRTMVVAVGTQLSHCTVDGNQYPTERPFSFNEGCFKFNCVCNSDGSWDCPSERSEYICPLKPGQIIVKGPSKKMTIVASNNMRHCNAMGQDYPLGRPFSFNEGCFKYNCECHHDGSWDCPASRAENICHRGRTDHRTISERKSHTRSMVIPIGTQLKFCTAQGNKYPLGKPFSFTEDCFRFNCECHHDGSWECPSEKSQYTCPLTPGKRIVRGPSKSMTIVVSNKLDVCTVRGQNYPLGQPFSFSDGCYTYQCECHSDGSWDCPADQAVDRCGHTRDRQPTKEHSEDKRTLTRSIVVAVGTEIRHCLVNEIQYALGSTFSFEDDCFRYKCECHPDGSWECPGDLAEYICHEQTKHVTRVSSRSFYVIIGDNIRSCQSNGNEYPLGRPFQYTDGCFRYSCQCHTDGSWECPADTVEDTCQQSSRGQQTAEETSRRSHTKSIVVAVGTQLRHCSAEGNQYALGRPFSFTEGCFRFNCDCHSNGSWECPSERSEYICQLQPGQKIVRAPSKSMSILIRDNARSCLVKGSEYRLGQPFSFTEGCFIYNCDCHRDGSWECPADRAVDRCRRTIEGQPNRGGQVRNERNRTSHTRSLMVSVGTDIRYCRAQDMHYTLGQPFSFREGCFEFHCMCHLNGSWDCPAERSEYKCKLEPGQQIVRAPSKSMSIVISDNVSACTANGVDYPLGKPFSFMDGCFIFNCDCHSDGSWECPQDRAVDRCRRTPDEAQRNRERDLIVNQGATWAAHNVPISVRGQVVFPGSFIRSCEVQDKTYHLGTTFSFTDDCFLYKCTCNTDGSWQCPGHLAKYSCQPKPGQRIPRMPNRGLHIIVGENVRMCTANGVEYDLGRTFAYMEGCFIYNCICHSDGSWECPFSQTVDRCRLFGETQDGANGEVTQDGHRSTGESKEQTSHTSSVVVSVGTEIKYCIAQETRFSLGQPFSFREGCFEFHCQCHHNGSWDCPAERSEYKCKPEPGQQIVRAPSKSMSIVISDDVTVCTANGQDYPLGKPFSFMDGCFIFNCDCHSDGSWECPQDRTLDRCRRTPEGGQRNKEKDTGNGHQRIKEETEGSRKNKNHPESPSLGHHPDSRTNPTACVNNDVRYPLGAPFSFTRDCFKFNCDCNMDGSWRCLSENSEYICQEGTETEESNKEFTEFETLSSGKLHRTEVTMCTADGKQYPLNQAFSFTVGCYRYNCECRRDGSWECPGHRVENTCRSLEGRSNGQVKRRNIQVVISNNLRTCTVKGVEFPLDHGFSFTDNCVKYNCHCFFDGSWDCPPERIEHACPTSGGIQHQLLTSPRLQRTQNSPLSSCVVEGVEYAAGSSFTFKAYCFSFKCQCFIDGSWECPSTKAEFICRDIPANQYSTNRTTGEGYSSQGIIVSIGSTPKFCSAYGLYHELNKPFIVTDGCFRLRCQCYSDGSWQCPSHQAIYFCPTNSRWIHRAASRSLHVAVSNRPTRCLVKGNQYSLGQPFFFTEECFRYHCICNIDGSWACPSKRVEDICPLNATEESRMQRASAVHGFPSDQQRVWFCMVKGIRYPIGRPFTYTDGCMRYNCDCKTDGSWNCPVQKSQNICHGQSRPAHRTQRTGCTVKGQTYYTEHFRYTDECVLYTCTCKNGSYNCPAELSTTIC